MIYIDFKESDIEQLFSFSINHPHHKVRLKMLALYLKANNLKHCDICNLCKIHEATFVSYLKQYISGGVEALKQLNYKGQPSALNAYKDIISKAFNANPPSMIKEARCRIQEITGIDRSPTQIREFLLKLGIRRLKTGVVPGSGKKENENEEKSKERHKFLEEKLEPFLNEAKKKERIVMFADASHFVLSNFICYLWSFCRKFLPSASGRQRYNVLGAINAVNHELIKYTNDKYINAKTVCFLLKKIYNKYNSLNLPITIILDNAKYQKCKLVRRYASLLKIELLYLPSYSPQLNLIERFWKFVKKECLYGKYFSNFTKLKEAIDYCISEPHERYKEELDSLLTWKFQTFSKVEILT